MITLHESIAFLIEGTLLALITYITANKKVRNSLVFMLRILLLVLYTISCYLIFKYIYHESSTIILICNAIYLVIILAAELILKPDYTRQSTGKRNYILSAIILIVLIGNIGAKYFTGKNYLLSEHVNVIVITDLKTNQEYTIDDPLVMNMLFDSTLEYNLNTHEIREINGEPAVQITTYRYDDIYCNTIELYGRNENDCGRYRDHDQINYYKVPQKFVESVYNYIDSSKE